MRDLEVPSFGPQHGFLFKLIARLSRWQLSSLLQSMRYQQVWTIGFAVLAGAVSLGTITTAAVLTDLPLLFPPLAPSAFILFYSPMSVQASPRNVIMAHTVAVLSGLFALNLVSLVNPAAGLLNPAVMNWWRVVTIALAMGLVTALMTILRCAHPPAAASALLGAMGYLAEPTQTAGLVGAAILLVLAAIFMNRIIGGLPYPVWRADERLIKSFALLAGMPTARGDHWQEKVDQILQRR